MVRNVNRESFCEIVKNEKWDDFRIRRLFDSVLAPVWVSRVLLELKDEPLLALKFFRWAEMRPGFSHTSEGYCILVHILFVHRFYSDVHCILRDIVCSGISLPGVTCLM
jgi:pentatricopeptide repeat domain-containing protein 1